MLENAELRVIVGEVEPQERMVFVDGMEIKVDEARLVFKEREERAVSMVRPVLLAPLDKQVTQVP